MNQLLKTTYAELSLKGRGAASFKIAKQFWLEQNIPWNQIAVFEDKKDKTRFSLTYYATDLRKAKRIQKSAKTSSRGLRLDLKILKPKDWADKWKEDYHIFPLGRKFDLIPVWEKAKYSYSRKIPIFLNPHSAFGSGKHESTRLMVRLITRYFTSGEAFLDLGCGTGILSVVASKLGASRVSGFDIDRYSVETARENFLLNRGQDGTFRQADVQRLHKLKPYDFIAANLWTDLLVKIQKSILEWLKPGGYLAVSGILLKNLKEFGASFNSPELQRLILLKGRRWAAVLYRRL